ncbi:hypothetical protein [Peptoniphilus hominis (ex Hitch et al. 2025)]|uniref:Lipoprotein n=1 Tax=Peptoniphilus hominis (ex Hitch et al. 2025) TaxID=3133174 RepID=A0ABV1CD57_9FIRM
MNNFNNFDEYIKDKLEKSVENSAPSSYLKNKIDLEIKSKEEKGEFKMKKKFIFVAALALVLSVGVFAAGKITGSISSSSHKYDYTEYTDLAKAEKKAGLEAYAPENLGDYKFDGITIINTADVDETGAKLNKRKTIDVNYKKQRGEDSDHITLAIDRIVEGHDPISSAPYKEMRTINGVDFYYSVYDNLFVGSKEDLSPADKERFEKDPFFNVGIGGKGSDRTEAVSTYLIFEYKGNQYLLHNMNFRDKKAIDPDEYFQMGESIIK